MKSLLTSVFIGALLLTPVTFASAQDHDGGHEAADGHDADSEHGPGLLARVQAVVSTTDFKGALVNFCLLIALFIYMGRKPVTQFFQSRKKQIEDDLSEAARLKDEAQAKYDEYAERLEKLDEELAQIREDMAAAGQKERDRLIADAETKAARLRKDTEFVIAQQLKQLSDELTSEAVAAAVASAREVLTSQTSESDQQKLAESYVASLKHRIDDGIDVQGGA